MTSNSLTRQSNRALEDRLEMKKVKLFIRELWTVPLVTPLLDR